MNQSTKKNENLPWRECYKFKYFINFQLFSHILALIVPVIKMYANKRRSSEGDKESSGYRMTSDERSKEILSKYKSPSSSIMSSADAGLPMNSLKSQWEKLMETDDLEEMDSPVVVEKQKHDFDSSLSSDFEGLAHDKKKKTTSYDVSSSNDDSFEISDTDLQVGAFAKKLAEEKINDRRMRASTESTTFAEKSPAPHITASPQAVSVSFALIPVFCISI
jgi:hypothetical protein